MDNVWSRYRIMVKGGRYWVVSRPRGAKIYSISTLTNSKHLANKIKKRIKKKYKTKRQVKVIDSYKLLLRGK